MRGKKVGVWCCGNEFELFAALTKNGIDPKNKDEVTIVNQPFDMSLFISKQVDAAAAMTYNELAQVLEQKNPDTGELYTLDDLNVITMEDAGTAMLEDGVFVRGDWIAEEANQDIAKRFLKAFFRSLLVAKTKGDNADEVTAGDLERRIAGQHLRERALAGAVGAHDRVDFARADLQGDALEDFLIADVCA